MIISICGIGNSGASAVVDYLRGFDDIDIFDSYEFQLLHQPDGINDLKYHLTNNKERITCNVAINRFIRSQKKGLFANQMRYCLGDKYDKWWKEYLAELVPVSWKGETSNFDPSDISNRPNNYYIRVALNRMERILKKINNKVHLLPYRIKYFGLLTEEEFDAITKKHLNKLMKLLDLNPENKLVIDMLFSSTNMKQGMEFFNSSKAILIDRDPRDIYVSASLHPEDSRFMPNNDSNAFVKYYRSIHECIDNEQDDRILIIKYEDLIYDYLNTTKKINDFLGILHRPQKEYKFFDPTYSEKYTNRQSLYKNQQLDIDYISKELNEYLYSFENKINPKDDPIIAREKEKSNVRYSGLQMQ